MRNIYSVTIIVPVYNAEKYIKHCVRTLFNQTLCDIEYVFVDDCSTDQSFEIIQQLIEEYPNRKDDVVFVRHMHNQGQAAARSSGLEKAKGEYIGWVDADDYVESQMFQAMFEVAKQQDADIVCCDIVRERAGGMVEERYPYEKESKGDVINHIEGGIYSALWNKIIRRSLYIEHDVKFADGVNMWDDLSVTFPLRYFSRKTMVIHKPFYIYNNINEGSITNFHRSRKFLMQKIKCMEHLMGSMRGMMKKNDYKKILEFGFKTKSLLFYPPYYDLRLWRESLQPSNRYVLMYSGVSFGRKLQYGFSLFFPFRIVDYILKKHYGLK